MSLVKKISVAASAVALSAGMAAATPTFTFTNVTVSPANTAYSDLFNNFMPNSSLRLVESFDGVATAGRPGSSSGAVTVEAAAQDTTRFSTPVGDFATLGGTPNNTATNSVEGIATELHIRSGDNFGRFNPLVNPDRESVAQIDGVDTNFLDSNDTEGISWTYSNPGLLFGNLVRSMQAFITDPNDANQDLAVSVFLDNVQLGQTIRVSDTEGSGNIPNATVWHFTLSGLETIQWQEVRVEFDKSATGDGIAISTPAVAAIPLPAPVLMMLAGLGALGGLGWSRRNREKATA